MILNTQAIGQSETVQIVGTLRANIVRKDLFWAWDKQISAPAALSIRLNEDGTTNIGFDTWPSFSLMTEEPEGEPELVTVGLRGAKAGTYKKTFEPPSRVWYEFAFPLTVTVNFDKDPLIGHKDQDCEISLTTGYSGQTQAWQMFNGNPAGWGLMNNYISLAGACEIPTWVFWFPNYFESRIFNFGIILEANLQPWRPSSSETNNGVDRGPECVTTCRAERNTCMQEVASHGGILGRVCAQQYSGCLRRC
jgi:hypothetical protein